MISGHFESLEENGLLVGPELARPSPEWRASGLYSISLLQESSKSSKDANQRDAAPLAADVIGGVFVWLLRKQRKWHGLLAI